MKLSRRKILPFPTMFQRKHYILAAILAAITLLFGVRFLWTANHEFLIYVVVIVFVSQSSLSVRLSCRLGHLGTNAPCRRRNSHWRRCFVRFDFDSDFQRVFNSTIRPNRPRLGLRRFNVDNVSSARSFFGTEGYEAVFHWSHRHYVRCRSRSVE